MLVASPLAGALAVAQRLHKIVNQQRRYEYHDDDERNGLYPPKHEAEENQEPGNADQAGDKRHHRAVPFLDLPAWLRPVFFRPPRRPAPRVSTSQRAVRKR